MKHSNPIKDTKLFLENVNYFNISKNYTPVRFLRKANFDLKATVTIAFTKGCFSAIEIITKNKIPDTIQMGEPQDIVSGI